MKEKNIGGSPKKTGGNQKLFFRTWRVAISDIRALDKVPSLHKRCNKTGGGKKKNMLID